MVQKLVITGVGPDQPGIVAGLTEVLSRHGCNIEDSSMTILAREFAMILIVSLPDSETPDTLRQDFAQLESALGLSLSVKPLPPEALATPAHGERPTYMISVAGRDRTGITAQVSRVLARHRVNITDLNAQVISGEGGEPVYIMMVEAVLPEGVTLAPVEATLRELEADLGVEIRLHPIEAVAL